MLPVTLQHPEVQGLRMGGLFGRIKRSLNRVLYFFLSLQVKHLLSSISLESDFVSPENVSQSYFMYRQLRHLPESQKQPIVDKLSVKNLIFHSVKNALATLERNKNGKDDDDDDDDKKNNDDEGDESEN